MIAYDTNYYKLNWCGTAASNRFLAVFNNISEFGELHFNRQNYTRQNNDLTCMRRLTRGVSRHHARESPKYYLPNDYTAKLTRYTV